MATEIKVPTLGESVSEAIVATWLKKAGEPVQADEIVAELETDKVTLEVHAPVAGVLSQLIAQEGETVAADAVLAVIDEGATASAAPAPVEVAPATPVAPAPVAPVQATPSVETRDGSGHKASPAVEKIAAEKNVDLSSLTGSGKEGRVTKGDLLAPSPAPTASVSAASASASAVPLSAREERVKMTGLRKTIARRLKEAQNTAAMLTTYNEADMTAVMDLRKEYRDAFEKRHGVRLGFMSFFAKACVEALKEIPSVNAEIQGDEIVYKNYYNIGVAVGTKKGLVVPVLNNVDEMSFAQVESSITAYGMKARDGKLSPADMKGGTFTISNGGVYGSLMSSPILNAPQSAILGMHKIQQRPVVVGGEIVIRPMMYLALSYDHRIIDGREAVTFLVKVKDALENPTRLLLGV